MKRNGFRKCMVALMICSLLCNFFYVPVFSENSITNQTETVAKASKAKSIKITGPKYVAKGKKITLKATVNPAKASQKVTWSTSDKKVATVSSKGVVKGVKAGKVTITATSKANPKVKKTWKMEVKAKAVSKVKITGAKDLDLAGTKTLTLKAKITPSKASKEVEWKSSNTKVAKVTEKGKVTAVGTGTAKITATAMDGSKKKATVTITVINSAEQGPTAEPTMELPTETPTPTLTPEPTPTPTPEPTPTPTPEPTDYDFSAGQFSYHYFVASDALMLTGSSATGHVTVPAQENGKPVTQIGENALTAGNVNAVTIPETVTTVASQHFPNQINYIELKGKDTSLTDLEKVNYIIAPAGGATEQTANTLGIAFVDASKVRSQDGFLYVVDNGQATLLCAVDSSAISGEVTLPETVDGVPVTGAESNALNGCADQITQLNYPESMSFPEDILDSDKLNKIIKVKGIVLSGAPEEMTAGETASLTAAVQPEDATNKAVTWSSSDESVLTVDENGTVTAVSYGEATVTAIAKDGSGIASDPVTIRVWNRVESIAIQNLPEALALGDAPVALQAVLTPDAATLKDANITWSLEGEGAEIVEGSLNPLAVGTLKVTVTVQDKSDTKEITIIRKVEDIVISGAPEELEAGETGSLIAAVTPEDATNKSVTWSSSDPAVATVSAEGVITAIGYGSATLTAAAQDIGGVTKSVTIRVWNVPESITIQNLPAEFETEGTAALTAVISPDPNTLKRKEIIWSSSDEAVVSIAEGSLTAASAGTATITAQIRDTELSDSKGIRVYDKAQSVTIHNAQAELIAGETLQLSAEVQPDTAIQTVAWSTSDGAIATINEGLVTAVAGGDVTITAQAGSQSDAITIHVWDRVSEIKITGAEQLDLYQDQKLTAQLSAEVLPATAHSEVVWSSENPEIATISETGLVTAVAVGTATIKATAMDGSGVTATTMVTVERSTYIVQENDHGTLTLCAFELQDGKAVIPSEVNGKTVTALAEGLFKGNPDLVELVVPATIAVVPENICEECINLREVELSDSIVKISKGAFKHCRSLTEFKLPTALKTIEAEAFYGDTSLADILLPEGFEYIGEKAFADSSVNTIYLPASINYIADDAFLNTSVIGKGFAGTYANQWFTSHGLDYRPETTPVEDFEWESINGIEAKITKYIGSDERVFIPAMIDDYDIVTIASSSFSGNSTLQFVSIPGSVRTIGSYAFSNCPQLSQVWLTEGVEVISNYAFQNCDSLLSFEFPESIIQLGTGVLSNCDKLQYTNYPVNATSIGSGTFQNCPLMTSITIDPGVTVMNQRFYDNNRYLTSVNLNNVTKIGEYSFENCVNLSDIQHSNEIVTLGEGCFKGCSSLSAFLFPESLITVGKKAFEGCSALTSAELPASVESIGGSAFRNCINLEVFQYPLAWNKSSGDGYGIGLDSIFYNCKKLNAIIIPEGVTFIPNGAFYEANYLRSVQLPSTLKSIHKGAFSRCVAIRSIEFPDGLEEVRAEAFNGCTALTTVNLPDSVTGIGEGAFAGCTALTSFHFPSSLDHVISLYDNRNFYDGNIFKNCIKLTSITIPEGLTTIPYGLFKGCNYLKNIYLPSTLTLIDSHSFENCVSLLSISFPEGLQNVNAAAFAGCSSLQEAELPDSLIGLGERSFDGCRNLLSFHYPRNLQHLNSLYDNGHLYEGNVLKNCEKITSVEIPSGVTWIPDLMFQGCNYLQTVIVPDSVTAISDSKLFWSDGQAFQDCVALEKIYISPNVTSIGDDVFKGCTNLTVWCEYGSTILQYCKDNDVDYYYLTPDGVNNPSGKLYKGDGYNLHGYARSSLPLTEITATIWNADKTETIYTVSVAPSKTDYSLAGTINNNMLFSKLTLGNYCYTLTAATTLSEETWADTSFAVVPPPLRVGINGFREFSNIVFDSSISLTGTVRANYRIDTLKISLINSSKTEILSRTVYPASMSYSLSNITLDLSSVSTDNYTIKITVSANGETKSVLQTPISVNSDLSTPAVSQELKEEIIEYIKTKKVGIFWPISQADSYLASMSTWDKILMGLSDYNSIALGAIKDWLTTSDYNSYMVKKYEAEIAQIVDDMYSEGKVGKLEAYGSFGEVIKDINGLIGDSASYELDKMNEEIDKLERVFGEPGQFEEMDALELVKDSTKVISDFYKGVKYGEDFINFLSELLIDHSQALEALEIIDETYNSQGDANFTRALENLRGSYKSKFGKTLIEVSRRIGDEVSKAAEKFITKSILKAAGASAESMYSLANTAAEMVIKYSGIEELGQSKIDFLTQYTSVISLQRAFENTCSDALSSYNNGSQLTDRQVNRVQVTFVAARQALLRLYQTLTELDSSNLNEYNQAIKEMLNISMPGVDALAFIGGGSR